MTDDITWEVVDPNDFSSSQFVDEDGEPCDTVDPQFVDEDNPEGICGGKVISTGGHGYYNGSYQCYTMYLHCDRCGDYEVECV